MHIVRGFGTGGTEMTCLRLAKHWQTRFDQTVVAWQQSPGTLEKEFLAIERCSLKDISSCQSRRRRWETVRLIIRKFAPDAIVSHVFGVPHLIVAAAARAEGIRAIGVKAGNPPPRTRRERRHWRAVLLASRVLRCPVMSCSHAVERELLRLGVGLPEGSSPIPNGIDVHHIAREAQSVRLTRTAVAPVVGMVARLDAIKDHDTLLCAFSIVKDEHPDAELWLIGDGELRATLEDKAQRLGIAASTRFLGERTGVSRLLGQMDVYAFSTTPDEGFGIALIEAMAAGVPIVASDVAACREVLADGDGGILVPPENPTILARAIASLLGNDSKRAQIAERAFERVESEYGIDACAARWERLLFPEARHVFATDLKCAS